MSDPIKAMESVVARISTTLAVKDAAAGKVEQFEDKLFPAVTTEDNDPGKVIGEAYWGALCLANEEKDATIQWVRARDLFNGADHENLSINVFGDNISHLDVRQASCGIESPNVRQGGILGTCWLLSSLACVAHDAPNLIKACFRRPGDEGAKTGMQLSHDGRYVMTLFDYRERKYVQVVIDDRIPCWPSEAGQRPTPLCAMPSDTGSVWPLLLEKAFAKFCGSYSNLDNMYGSWALAAIAGRKDGAAQAFCQMEDEDVWNLLTPAPLPRVVSASGIHAQRAFVPSMTIATDVPKTTKEMLEFLREKLLVGNERQSADHRHIALAIADGKPLTELGCDHAYSVLDVQHREVALNDGSSSMVSLIKMRNPFGSDTKWKGDWSDSSDLWSDNHEVAKAVEFDRDNTSGEFWVSDADFGKLFDHLHVLRTDDEDELTDSLPSTEILSSAEPVMAETSTQAAGDAAAAVTDLQYATGIIDPCWEDPKDAPGAASAPPEEDGTASTGDMYDGIARLLKPLFGNRKIFMFNFSTHKCTVYVEMVNSQVFVTESNISGAVKANVSGAGGGGELSGSVDRKFEYKVFKKCTLPLGPKQANKAYKQRALLVKGCDMAYVTIRKEEDKALIMRNVLVDENGWACVYQE